MKTSRIFAVLFLLAPILSAQSGVRWDLGGPVAGVATTVNQPSLNGQNADYLIVLGPVQLNWCSYPANSTQGSPCTNFALTYTDLTLTTACPSNQPIVLQQTNICASQSDNSGNLGVNALGGTYSYTLTYGTTTFGPYAVTLGGGGGFPDPFPPPLNVGGVSFVAFTPDPYCAFNLAPNFPDYICEMLSGDLVFAPNGPNGKLQKVAFTDVPQTITQAQTFTMPLTSAGTVAALTGTGACATITTQLGGSWAGSAKCTGTTGASTLIITPGFTAPNGWTCHVQDETTRANLLQQTSHSATACTLTATSVTANDVFVFSAVAF
jgi:hypothetical protein